MLRSTWPSRLSLIALITVAGGALAAPAEAASTGVASVSGTKVKYKAAKGKQNKVVVTRSGRTITIDDKVRIEPGKGCKAVKGDKTKVRCTTRANPTRVSVYTYDRNDSVVNKTDLPMTADGGSGKDRLVGGPRGDRLTGDTGNDWFDGGDGGDLIVGGDGNDTMYGGNGDDTIHGTDGSDRGYGGPGRDSFYLDPVITRGAANDDYVSGGTGHDAAYYAGYDKSVTIDADGVTGDDGAKGEHDTIAADIEELQGGNGNDRINGTNRQDFLYGGPGNDIIRGGAGNDILDGFEGRDQLYGDAGDDMLSGEDFGAPAAADRLDGGSHTTPEGDYCLAYRGDVRVNCES
ncbi:calcium-binding protein [Actinoplanes sp. NPDC051346]|uniref:calcium-binding protein n=1 Tax=Actinoplanes sp. NPDC051346 TaxID=3155048 RepID=UPI00341F3259